MISSVLFSLSAVLLILVLGVRVRPSQLSRFELHRRAKRDRAAESILAREERLNELATLVWIKTAVLLVLTTLCAIWAFGWGLGVVVALAVAVCGGALARIPLIHRASQTLWERTEPMALRLMPKLRPVLHTLRTDAVIDAENYRRFDSREELTHLIDQSKDLLTPSERKVLVHALQFPEVRVNSVMTPRTMIESIKKDEFLGPLVLHELHEKGHSRLPVIDEDLNNVVGVLHIRDLLSLDTKESATAQQVMDRRVFYIRQDDSLEHALAAFLKTRRHLFIVINEHRETVGLVTLEDTIEALLGRRIMDEDDIHEDLRAVATQQARHRNTPKDHVDL